MDTSAQNTPVATPMQRTTQEPVAQQAPPQPAVSQPTVTPVTPAPVGRHPEQGPVAGGPAPREAAPIDDAEAVAVATDDSAAQPDEVSDVAEVQKETIQIQESQPSLELSKEEIDAGVKEGEDSAKERLPEEQIVTDATKADQQTVVGALPTDPAKINEQQVEETKKKSKIRDSIKWFAALLLYQWKKLKASQPNNKIT